MQLPRGILEKSHRGPVTLEAVTEGIASEGLTGYLRVSILSDNASESVIVYRAGKPVMAFVSGAKGDLSDPGMSAIAASIRQANCIIEICKLGEKQVALLQEIYGHFAYVEPLPPAKPVEKPAAVKQAPAQQQQQQQQPARPAAHAAPQEQVGAKPGTRFVMPEIRGKFIRSEELGNIREYTDRYPGDTGHLLLIINQNGAQEEHHAIIAGGCIEAVYNDQGIVPGIPGWLEGMPGVVEFYAVDPAALTSVLLRSLKGMPRATASRGESPAASPAPAQHPAETAAAVPAAMPPRPVEAQPQAKPPAAVPEKTVANKPAYRPKPPGVAAKTILEKSRAGDTTHVEDEITRTVDEISRSMDDDIAMVRKVEQDFALHADELLEKLDLGHLRKNRRK